MKHDVMSDTWVATDALGRLLPGYEECGPPRENRYVGIFYFIARNYTGPDAPRDVTKLLHENPEHPQFWPRVPHHWGEPEFGYYRSSEKWVIRKHAYMLADAGVDTLIFDVTNNQTFPDTYEAVLDTFRQIRGEGEATPDVCFLASERSAFQLWEQMYSKGRYADLWFMWKGKPLLLFGQHGEIHGDMNDVIFPPYFIEFFTIRRSWAWDSLSWYRDNGYRMWPWVAHTPQCVGWDVEGIPEHVPVAIGEHPLSNIGRSFHNGKQPETDQYDVTPLTECGPYFEEQWAHALKVDPEFIFVTGWNEWSAGGQICTDPSYEALQAKWSFFPGAQLGRAGKPLKVGDVYFIDQYNQEYSRDAEPMRGYHTDNYYYQLVDGIRRYKGVRPLPQASPARTMDLNGTFRQWDTVMPEYRDHLYDTIHRVNERGWGSAGPYTNTCGRNEFVSLKVARDISHIYFYARTRAPLTPRTDPNWMLLFLNTDHDKTTGWEGYNYLLNSTVLDQYRTSVKSCTGGWEWSTIGDAQYRVEGNELMIAVSRALLGLETEPLQLDFHWVDNIRGTGDIADFFDCGDSAPPRRFDYRYRV
jgi:hypothetical protein